MEWISVEERLPESWSWYLVVDRSLPHQTSVTMAFFDKTGECVCESEPTWLPLADEKDYAGMDVTHWMPLPDPPQKEPQPEPGSRVAGE